MERKQKKFLRRKNIKNTESNIDICNVNIVTEAEKIVEEYVSRMGYNPIKKKNPVLKTLLLIAMGIVSVWFASALLLKIFPG